MSNVLIVHAHPEPQSLTSSLKNLAVETLEADGHDVQVSDLYSMHWNPVASGHDFLAPRHPERLRYASESRHAFTTGTQTDDVAAEQQKLLWADAVIMSFPLWWYSEPAILKGWIERVYANGFTYGVGQHGGERWGDRFGEGVLEGRRAMLIVSIGGREPHYGTRGVNGRIDEILWPLQHGVLFYPGMQVLNPFVLYQSDRMTTAQWPDTADALRARMHGLFTDTPVPYRTQNGGHYDGAQVLKPGLGTGEDGVRIHLVQPGDPPETLPHAADTGMQDGAA